MVRTTYNDHITALSMNVKPWARNRFNTRTTPYDTIYIQGFAATLRDDLFQQLIKHQRMSESKTPLTYKDAGVDIDAGNELVERIKPLAAATKRAGSLGSLGGFGGLFELPSGYRQPILVSGTDGVGTKLKLAIDADIHHTVGIDLVAMCVNDIIVCGAEPLYFLDYFATGALNVDHAERVISGIAEGCKQAECALNGGETAEMPGLYAKGDYDLAGFAVGVVEKDEIIDGSKVTDGDVIIALSSSGLHSNGFSLVRKIVQHAGADLNQSFGDDQTLAEALLTPTRIYVRSIKSLLDQLQIKSIAHITGVGLLENVQRVLPKNVSATISRNAWTRPALFQWLQEQGGVDEIEMLRTFNCGIGMVIVVDRRDTDDAIEHLSEQGENAFIAGAVVPGTGGVSIV